MVTPLSSEVRFGGWAKGVSKADPFSRQRGSSNYTDTDAHTDEAEREEERREGQSTAGEAVKIAERGSRRNPAGAVDRVEFRRALE